MTSSDLRPPIPSADGAHIFGGDEGGEQWLPAPPLSLERFVALGEVHAAHVVQAAHELQAVSRPQAPLGRLDDRVGRMLGSVLDGQEIPHVGLDVDADTAYLLKRVQTRADVTAGRTSPPLRLTSARRISANTWKP